MAFTSTPVAALSPATSRLSVASKDSESMLRSTGTVPDGAALPEPDTPVEGCQDGSSDGGSGDMVMVMITGMKRGLNAPKDP